MRRRTVGSNPTLSATLFLKLNHTSTRRNTQAGRRGAPAKGVGRVTVARVQIPLSPPNKIRYPFGYRIFVRLSREKRDLNPKGADGVKKNSPGDCFLDGWCAVGHRNGTLESLHPKVLLPSKEFLCKSNNNVALIQSCGCFISVL